MVFYSYAETKQAQVDGQYYSTPTFSPPYWAPPQGPALTQAPTSCITTPPWCGEEGSV